YCRPHDKQHCVLDYQASVAPLGRRAAGGRKPHGTEVRWNMRTDRTTRPWRTAFARSAAPWATLLFILGLTGWLAVSYPDGSAWKAVSLVAVLALAALVGSGWHLSGTRADRRWRAALDRYAERELAKRTYPRRDSHARAHSQAG